MNIKRAAVLFLLWTAALCASALAQDVAPLKVTAVTADGTALPGAVLTSAPGSIVVTFSEAIDAATVSTDTFRLVRSGGDGRFVDGNEVEIAPTSVMLDGTGTQAAMELAGVPMVNDDYQVKLSGTLPPAGGLVAHWKFDETGGTTATDASGNGSHGLLVNGAAWRPSGGRIGGAIDFDGNDDRVIVPASTIDGLGDVTTTFWVRSVKTGSQAVVSGCNATSDKEHTIYFDPDTSMYYSNHSWVVPSIADDSWHHVAMVRDATSDQVIAFFDGVELGPWSKTLGPLSIPTGGLVLAQEQDTVGGGFDPTQALDGMLDDFRFYDRALSPGEIATLAGGLLPVTDLSANLLDGEYSGSLPSGDGTPGGDFVCTFTINNVTAPAPVTDLSLSAGDESVTVAWRNPFDTDFAGVVVLRRVGAAPTGTPTDGVSYDVGNALGDAFVVYVGTGTAGIPGDRSSWENTGLLNDTEYHYTIFAYDEAMNYSAGASASAVAGASGGGDGGLCSPGSSASPVLFLLALTFALAAALACRLPGTPCRRGIDG